MRGRFNRICSLVLVTVMLFAAVSCGGGHGTDDTVTTDTTAAEPMTTEPDTTVSPDTDTEPVTETDTEPATETETETETTAPVTTEPPLQKTAKPTVLGYHSVSSDRVIVYGSTEPGAMIRSVVNGYEEKNRANDKYFYIEVGASSQTEIKLYAQAEGKSESSALTYTLEPTGESMNVWGGRNSRIFYMPTLNFLLGNRADEGSIDQLASYIAGKTITEIQKATGKETKLIYAIIPDPATCYYDEQRDYVQHAVEIPPKTAMQSFISKINGVHKDVYAVDLLPALRAHKDQRIYFTTDTHYTELGAYYSYLEIMKKVKQDHPAVTPRTVENGDYKIEYIDVPGGDMCGMAGIGMNEVVPFFVANFEDTGSYYVSKRNDGIKSAGFGPGGWERDSQLKNSSNPTVYFLGDSYGCYILPFIGANFSKVWTNPGVLWSYDLDKTILEQNKPDYVILLVCQRNVGPDFMNNLITSFSMSVSSF